MMKTLLFSNLFLFVSLTVYSQTLQNIVDTAVEIEKTQFPEVGIVVGIYNNNKTTYHAYGTLTKDSIKKTDSLTLFEIGSATKTFTSLVLAIEMEKGHIKETDLIDTYIPPKIHLNNNIKNKIYLTDLVTHQSGLPNLSNDTYFEELLTKDPTNPFQFVTKQYILDILSSTESVNTYGEYQYNNYSYALLGLLLEEQFKQSYEDIIHNEILKPLNLTHTTFSAPKNNPNIAGLYNQQGEPQQAIILNKVNPAGGLLSNATDLIAYLKAHINKNDLTNAILKTQKTFYKDKNKHIGLGWEIEHDYYQKDGDTFGNSCLLRYSPTQNTAIVVLSNHQNGQLVRNIMNTIYSKIIDLKEK